MSICPHTLGIAEADVWRRSLQVFLAPDGKRTSSNGGLTRPRHRSPDAAASYDQVEFGGCWRRRLAPLAVFGNGAAVRVEDGDDHSNVEPVRVGYRASD